MDDRGKAAVTEGINDQIAEREAFIPSRNAQEQSEAVDEVLTTADPLGLVTQNTSVSSTVGAFTVQCAKCMKWRFIPTKAQYEAIRQSIIKKPFFCSSATEWRPRASCDDPFEISPDMHELWAFDKPGIPLPPSGWERLLVIRPAGSVKFADIYYVTPSGKKLRSMPEIERFLSEHPEYVKSGLKSSQFSFIIPRPLDREYCRKKNESLLCGEKGPILPKKANAKSISADPHPGKLGLVKPSFKATPSRPKLEKLKFRKKAHNGESPRVEFQMLHSELQSSDVLANRQVMKSTISSQELQKKGKLDGSNAAAANNETERNTIRNSVVI